jgi:hypothetical protein
MRFKNPPRLGLLLLGFGACLSVPAQTAEFHGAGWMQFGRIENAWAGVNSPNDYDENWIGNYGGLLSSNFRVDENWEAGLGVGSLLMHLARGNRNEANIWYPFWVGFLNEARFTWSNAGYAENGGFQLTVGTRPYNYNRDAKNLGVYLLRGYVYPGTVVSGFADRFAVPASRSGLLGRVHLPGVLNGLTNDLMINVETEDKPFYDISVADVVDFRLHPGLEVGAGVNFYRLLAAEENATSPGKDCTGRGPDGNTGPGGIQDSPCFIQVPNAAGGLDTVTGSLSGTKLMARFRIDPKAWFGSPGVSGADEWVLYGEAAVLGLKDYPIFYDDIMRRIPAMVGFNVPTAKLFNLSLEAEYYASKNSSDNLRPQNGSWLPSFQTRPGTGRDDWKWSVNASKVVLGNVFVGAQVANDHLRLGGTHNVATGQEALRTLSDYYWVFKTAYFF